MSSLENKLTSSKIKILPESANIFTAFWTAIGTLIICWYLIMIWEQNFAIYMGFHADLYAGSDSSPQSLTAQHWTETQRQASNPDYAAYERMFVFAILAQGDIK